MALVRDFENGVLDMARLNYAIITLIPKEPDAKLMKQFRPISLGNCSINFFSKPMTNRDLLVIGYFPLASQLLLKVGTSWKVW